RVDEDTLAWSHNAILLARCGSRYTGKTSPHWYAPDIFHELLQSAGSRTARELIAEFDGCAEPKAGRIAAPFKGRLARSLDRDEERSILVVAKVTVYPVS